MQRKDQNNYWFVAFAASMLMFLETGIVKSFGVLLPPIREQFSTKTWVIGLAISLTPGFGSIVCILSGAINKVLKPRLTIISFASLFSIGVFVTTFATDIYVLSVTLLFTGFNTATTSISIGALSQYFDKNYKLAVTWSSTGMSLGMTVMPLVTQFLFETYGWRGTVLLLSAISAHGIVCGAVFRTPSFNCEYDALHLYESIDVERVQNSCENFTNYVKDILDLNLFTKFSFIAYLSLFGGAGFYTTGWLIYVVPHVIEVGFSPYQASLVATAGGFANVIGNISYPLTENISTKLKIRVCVMMITASFALDVIASAYVSYFGLIMCAVAFGFARGLMTTASYPILKERVDENQMINAVAWTNAMYGVASVLSGFISGWLFEQTGSYTLSFLVSAAVCLGTLIPQCMKDICNT